MSGNHLGKEKGFTLIELIIVLLIIGATIGLAAPRIGRSIDNMRMRSAVRRFAAVLRYTRQMAISRKKEYSVVIAQKSYSYTKVERKSEDAESGGDEPVNKAGHTFSGQHILEKRIQVDLPKAIKNEKVHLSYQPGDEDEEDMEGGAGRIIFYPKGESTGGRVILAIEDSNLAFKVDVDPVTGKIRVERKDEEE
ncbi:MAG: GspH/FimT family pseudopilin [bacterium]